MNLSNIAYTACVLASGFALTVPQVSAPEHAPLPSGSGYAYVHSAHVYRHVQHYATQAKISSNNMTALVAAWTISQANIVKEADGLSRNADDCNDGCIDH